MAHRVERLTGTARLPFCGTRHEREGRPAHSKTPFLYYTATSAAMQKAGGLRLGSACALALAGESPRPYVSGCMILGFMAAARSQACAPGPSCGAVWPPVPRFPAIRGCIPDARSLAVCAVLCNPMPPLVGVGCRPGYNLGTAERRACPSGASGIQKDLQPMDNLRTPARRFSSFVLASGLRLSRVSRASLGLRGGDSPASLALCSRYRQACARPWRPAKSHCALIASPLHSAFGRHAERVWLRAL